MGTPVGLPSCGVPCVLKAEKGLSIRKGVGNKADKKAPLLLVAKMIWWTLHLR